MDPDRQQHPSGRADRIHRLVGLEPPTLRRSDISAASRVDPERAVRWWRAMGFPEVPEGSVAFNQDDADIVKRLGALEGAGLIEEEDVLRLARLLGASFQRIAEAQLAVVDDMLEAMAGPDGDATLDRLGALIAADNAALVDVLETSVVYVWRRHLLAALGKWLGTEEASDDLAVGFADLSGFTKFSKSLAPDRLTEVIDQFEAVAFDAVSGHGGRVVKLIGDEVMFASASLTEAAWIAIEIGERLGEIDGMPMVHSGIAKGPVVGVGGDIFGPTVNLASRLTGIARPGTVVIPLEQSEDCAADPGLSVRRLRRKFVLKGIGEERVASVTRSAGDEGPRTLTLDDPGGVE